ncbi:MAG: CarD family transcriptional regulator [Firmicutes bacterium]|nr:CarD family transcriptional regulator [Bacillota bacterium]
MYKIGDKILYPMHGAGIIRQIEKKEILGELKEYYIMNIACGNMEVMIPVETCDKIGVRPVVAPEKIDEVVAVMKEESSAAIGNWNKRYRDNTEKIKTGDIIKVAEIFRNLLRADENGKISAGEKKMLNNIRKILLSEIMLSLNISEDEARDIVEYAVK